MGDTPRGETPCMLHEDFKNDTCRIIQDPIHGTIALTSTECRVIDHPIVQRLRTIRQLGNASLVFPSATHSRFSHALGVMHQAGELFLALARSLGKDHSRRMQSPRVRKAMAQVHQRVRLAGLLHDVGHGPFSHHFETVLHDSGATVATLSGTELTVPQSWIQLKSRAAYLNEALCHEHLSAALISHLGLEDALARSVISLLDPRFLCGTAMEEDLRCLAAAAGAPQSSWTSLLDCLRSIISGEIDADRMDYLRRDAYFCGVDVRFDAQHLVRSLSLVLIDRTFCIAIERNAVFALEQMLLARKQMFSQVYQNKTNLVLDHLLSLAVHNLRQRNMLSVPRSLAAYLELDDTWMLQQLRLMLRHDKGSLGDLATKMYLTRTLPISIASLDIPVSDWIRTERTLRRKHPKADFVVSAAKDLLASKQVGPIMTQKGLSGRYVPVAQASELVQSRAWSGATLRVVVVKNLNDSAVERDLAEQTKHLIPETLPQDRGLRLIANGRPRGRATLNSKY